MVSSMVFHVIRSFFENGFIHTNSIHLAPKYKMSSNNSYRPSYSAGWRQREAEKARARKEEAEKKQYARTETNFPSLIGVGGQTTHVTFDNKFSTLASNWQKADDIELVRQAIEKEKARKAQNEFAGVYIHQFREGRLTKMEEEEEEYVEQSIVPPKVDHEGWEEVKKKARKNPRELSMAELAKKYQDAASDEEKCEEDMNGHLFDNRRRDELY
jgi:hypothetical protein